MTKESMVDTLWPLLAAIRIHSNSRFSIGEDARIDVLAQDPKPEAALLEALQTALYHSCYVRKFSGSGRPPLTPAVRDEGFARSLSGANCSREMWDRGWTIDHFCGDGSVEVHKGGRHYIAYPGFYVHADGMSAAHRLGGTVNLLMPRESSDLQPGFYVAFGETVPDQYDDCSLLRIYFNTQAQGAPLLLEIFTRELNRFTVPFRMKCPVAPSHYDRSDAVVLYVPRRYFHLAAHFASQVKDTEWLRLDVPLFTKRLAAGIAAADDPGNGESFGMHRCRLLAQGMIDAWQDDKQTVEARLAAIRSRFIQNGLLLDRPYLNPHSRDIFELPCAVDLAIQPSTPVLVCTHGA